MPSIAVPVSMPLRAPSASLMWSLFACFIALTLLVAAVARHRWTKHKTRDELMAVHAAAPTESGDFPTSDTRGSGAAASLSSSLSSLQSVSSALLSSQSSSIGCHLDRLRAESEQVKALLAVKLSDQRGYVQAALSLLMSEIAAGTSYRSRQARREDDVSACIEAARAVLSDLRSAHVSSSAMRDAVQRLSRAVTIASSESKRELDRKERVRGHSSIIGEAAITALEQHTDHECECELRVQRTLQSLAETLVQFKFTQLESEIEREEQLREADERKQQSLAGHARQSHEKRVARAAVLLFKQLAHAAEELPASLAEVRAARKLRVESEAAALSVLEAQRAEAEARHETGMLAGLDEELKEAVKQLIRHAHTTLARQQQLMGPRGKPQRPNESDRSLSHSHGSAQLVHIATGPVGYLSSLVSHARSFEPLLESVSALQSASAASLASLPSASWLAALDFSSRSASALLHLDASHARHQVAASLQLLRPADPTEVEDHQLRAAERSVRHALDAQSKSQDQSRRALISASLRSVSRVCAQLNESELRAQQHCARLEQQIAAGQDQKCAADATGDELQVREMEKKLDQFQQERLELERDRLAKRASSAKDIERAHTKLAQQLQATNARVVSQHQRAVDTAVAEWEHVRSMIADRHRALAAQADMEDADGCERALRQLEAGEAMDDATERQLAATRDFHAASLDQLTREQRESTRARRTELETERHAETAALNARHEAELEELRAANTALVDSARAAATDSASAAAVEQELRGKFGRQERTKLAQHREERERQELELQAVIEREMATMQRQHREDVQRERAAQSEELRQIHAAAAAKAELRLLTGTLSTANQERAKPLIEAALEPRHHHERAALIDAQAREMAEQLQQHEEAALRDRGARVAELHVTLQSGMITEDEFAREVAAVERALDPTIAASALQASLTNAHSAALAALEARQAAEIRATMQRFYPTEDFRGLEWARVSEAELQRRVRDAMESEAVESAHAQQQRARWQALEGQQRDELTRVLHQLTAECEEQIAAATSELRTQHAARLEEMDRARWIRVQDWHDQCARGALTEPERDEALRQDERDMQAAVAAANAELEAQCQQRAERLRHQCRDRQANLSRHAQQLQRAAVGDNVESAVQLSASQLQSASSEAVTAFLRRAQRGAQQRKAGLALAVRALTQRVELGKVTATPATRVDSAPLLAALDRIEACLNSAAGARGDAELLRRVTASSPLVPSAELTAAHRRSLQLCTAYVSAFCTELGIAPIRVRARVADSASSPLCEYRAADRELTIDATRLLPVSAALSALVRAMPQIATRGQQRNTDDPQLLDRAIAALAVLVADRPTVDSASTTSRPIGHTVDANEVLECDTDDEWLRAQRRLLEWLRTSAAAARIEAH